MATVVPFHAIRYSAQAQGGLAALVAPPYDVIPDDAVPGLLARSPHNVVRLTRPGTDYRGAAELERRWLAEGILMQDPRPAFYLHEQAFAGGVRRGLFAAVGLAAYGTGQVFPHEKTHGGAKADRLELYRATATALEPLWFVYRGAGTRLPELLVKGFAGPPAIEFEADGDSHRVWMIDDPAWQSAVTAEFAGLPLLIADGHHRYVTALTYAEETGAPAGAAARHALVLLVDIADPGLVVLPTHRVLRVAPVRITGGEPAQSLEDTLKALEGRVAAGHYAGGSFQVLPLEGELPLVELHQQLIDNLLGRRSAEDVLLYTRDPQEAVRWVDEGKGQQAFFLGAPDLGAVLTLAEQGRTLPQKSTFFHPKPPSGMLFLGLDQAAP
ncbi:MAG: DUF1015 domain-containing protein [Candidatus Dormibacteraeota bacterium]|nr:DUF1015 domain-containing protein [Candidatus Dormibacteraeota bacterium]